MYSEVCITLCVPLNDVLLVAQNIGLHSPVDVITWSGQIKDFNWLLGAIGLCAYPDVGKVTRFTEIQAPLLTLYSTCAGYIEPSPQWLPVRLVHSLVQTESATTQNAIHTQGPIGVFTT